ncbi:MAG: gamma-glutamylcyclotransferase [Pseudomonadota bacterium]
MATDGIWIFGYGSLIWNPEFPFEERCLADLSGYVRRFCMASIHHRGSPSNPGLVLALDRAASSSCRGMAFRIGQTNQEEHLNRLRERELVSSAYIETVQSVTLSDGRIVNALCYVVDRDHEQYIPDQPLAAQAHQIARSVGGRGPNTEYLFQTVESLRRLGIEDPELEWLHDKVRQLEAASGSAL